MKRIHKKIEAAFERFTEIVYRRKYIALACMLAVGLTLAAQVPDLTVDTRDESFFMADDPTLLAYNRFRDTFGQDDLFIVSLEAKEGLTPALLATLHSLHRELARKVPYLDDITSLVNGRVVLGRGDTLTVDELMKEPPESEAALARLREMIGRYPLYEKLLVAEDRTLVSILIKPRATVRLTEDQLLEGFDGEAAEQPARYLTNAENIEITTAIREALEPYAENGATLHMAGTPAVVAELTRFIEADMRRIMPLSFLLIILFLLLLFRRVSGVLYPLAVVTLSLLSTLGIMALLRIPITPVIQILPSFLVVVGIGDAVHILTLFYRALSRGAHKQIGRAHV